MSPINSGIDAFSILGIRIRIDRSWFIAFLLFAWTLSVAYFPAQAPDQSAFTYWVAGAISALGLFASVLLHELSHCIVAQKLGVRVRQITLFIFGGVSEMDQTNSRTPAVEFYTAIAGPVSSLGLGFILLAAGHVANDSAGRLILEMTRYLGYVNFLLGAFNLIPGFPLDGGRLLRSYLWHRTGNLQQATKSAARVGVVFAMMLIGAGLLAVPLMHPIPGIWLILIGWFLKKSAEKEYRSFEFRFGLQNMKVQDVMTQAVAVKASTTISEFVSDYAFRYHSRIFPVQEQNRFVGMIDVRSIRNVPTIDWPNTAIGDFLSEPSTYCVFDSDINAIEALETLTTHNCSKAPIVRDGKLIGMLMRSDVLNVITQKRDKAA